MTRIAIFSSHPAERGLLLPLINRLEAHPAFELEVFSLHPPADFSVNYDGAHNYLKRNPPDIVLIPCDRLEALAAAIAAFEMGIPIIHFHAGDTGTVSKDEMHRHAISLMASVHLCNGPSAQNTVTNLLSAVERECDLVFDVGSTIVDDIEIDTSLCPDDPYNLVLYNPPINDPELIKRDLDEIEKRLDPDIVTVWCAPNGDPGSDSITMRIKQADVITYTGVPRTEFLGLMKNCEYYIGNSSSMVCEAPMWLEPDQIVHIGDRNRNRSCDPIRPGATDQIVKILEDIENATL
jgi:UDP-N-acetylglucosamine 2-epimerase (non-hydrolysing)/GDP/UDP-N,N'-diacetylbacillosamine 2-epimerase (hydrolysing)